MIRYDNVAEAARAGGVSRAALLGSNAVLIRTVQKAQGVDACFRTEKRYTCGERTCEWRGECCRLVAAWRL